FHENRSRGEGPEARLGVGPLDRRVPVAGDCPAGAAATTSDILKGDAAALGDDEDVGSALQRIIDRPDADEGVGQGRAQRRRAVPGRSDEDVAGVEEYRAGFAVDRVHRHRTVEVEVLLAGNLDES